MAALTLQASDKPQKLRKDDIPRNEKQMWARIDAMQDEVEANLLSHDQRFLDELELARKKVADIMLTSESDKKDKVAVEELRQRSWTFWTRLVSEVEVEDVKEYNLNTALGQRVPAAQQSATHFQPFQQEEEEEEEPTPAPRHAAKLPRHAPSIDTDGPEIIYLVKQPTVHSDGTPVYRDQYGNEPNPVNMPSYLLPPFAQPSYAVRRENYVQYGYTSSQPHSPIYVDGAAPVKSYPKKGQAYVGSGRTSSATYLPREARAKR